MLLGSIGQKAEVANTHEAIGEHVEEKTADEFVSIKRQSLFSIPIFSIPVAKSDLAVFEAEDPVIGQSHPVGVAAEIVKDRLWRTERLFRVDDPVLSA